MGFAYLTEKRLSKYRIALRPCNHDSPMAASILHHVRRGSFASTGGR